MEHLPSRGLSEPIVIRFRGKMYDGGEWTSYPERQGWDKEKIYRGDFTGRTFQETSALFQSWLYFGVLSEVLAVPGADFDPWDFIRTLPDGRQAITSEKLVDYLRRWRDREAGWSAEQKRERYHTVDACLRETKRFTNRYCHLLWRPSSEEPTFWPVSGELALSIIILADTLSRAVPKILNGRAFTTWGPSLLLYRQMMQAGWCANVIGSVASPTQLQLQYYTSTLGKPLGHGDHTECKVLKCKRNVFDENNYSVKHVPGCVRCEFKGPSMHQIIEILKQGHIPVVTCQMVNGVLQVEVREGHAGDYVALSHVWSDGLGNPRNNLLPSCQLKRLQSLMNQAVENAVAPVAWWCDTLCVPVHLPDEDSKNIAIQRMRETFERACKVVAIDDDLAQISKNADIMELYARLRICKWIRRLWTLQEAIVARDILIRFSNGFRSFRDLYSAIKVDHRADDRNLYYEMDYRNFFSPFVSNLEDTPLRQGPRFELIWKLIQYRATSFQADEPVVLANTIGVNSESILTIPRYDPDARMLRFWQSLVEIPLSILFQAPPRLTTRGFRWAPKTLLSCFRNVGTDPFCPNAGFGRIGPGGKGLQLKSPGFRLISDQSRLPLIGKSFSAQVASLNSSELFCVTYAGPIDAPWDGEACNVDGSRTLRAPAIILSWAVTPGRGGFSAALVDLCQENEDENRLSCDYIALAGVERVFEGLSAVSLQRTDNWPVLEGEYLAEDQEWLVN